MPPESDTITTFAPPPKQSYGSKYLEALAKVEAHEKTAAPPTPTPEDKSKPEEKPIETGKPADKTPSDKTSPLDVILDDKTTPPTPTAPDPKDDLSKTIDELDAIKVPKSEHWERARNTLKTQSQALKSRLNEIEKLKTDLGKVDPTIGETLATRSKELETIKAENSKLRDAITALNVEYDPQFQEKFVAGREKLVDRAVNRVKEYGGNLERFAEAMSLTGKRRTEALREALTDVDDLDKPRIISVLDQIQQLDDERSELRKDPKQTFEKFSAQRREEQERLAADAERVKKAEFEKTVAGLRDKSPLLRPVDPNVNGGAEWNDQIKSDVTRAEKMFGNDAQFPELVEVAVKGARYDWLEKMFLDTRKELLELKKRMGDDERSRPDFRGTGKLPAAKDTRSPAEKYRDALNNLQTEDEEV